MNLKQQLVLLVAMMIMGTILTIQVSAIESVVCVPILVNQGSTISCEAELASGNSEKGQAYNFTFFNQSLDGTTKIIPGCSFTGTTENSPSPANVVEGCTIPTNYGQSNISFANFNLTTLNINVSRPFNITATSSVDLRVTNFKVETPVFLGKTSGISWEVSKGDTGTAVIGAQCTGDVVQSIGGEFIPIASATGELGTKIFISKFGGRTLTSLRASSQTLEPGETYIVEVNCDCVPGSGGCISQDGTTLVNATSGKGLRGSGTTSFTVTDLGDLIRVRKWNLSNNFVVGSAPHVFLENQFGAKTQVKKNPTYQGQHQINWTIYNQTIQVNISQNGQAFLTAGQPAAVCMVFNNTFDHEKVILIREVTFDSDELEKSFFPVDIHSGNQIKNEIVLQTGIKSIEEGDGLQKKCSEPFLIPSTGVKGGNDWDVQFEISIEEAEGFSQNIQVESDEFAIYAEKVNSTFVPIVDITQITTNKKNVNATSCTDMEVSFSYNYYGEESAELIAQYCFENTDRDVIEQCENKIINPDVGENKIINDTLKVPFFKHSGAAEVTVTIWKRDKMTLIGFGDTEPQNTFNITINTTNSCEYGDDPMMLQQQRAAQALETISASTGTFQLILSCQENVPAEQNTQCKLTGKVERGTGQKELKFNCFFDEPEGRTSSKVFKSMIFDTETEILFDMFIPGSFSPGEEHTIACIAQTVYLGVIEAEDSFSDNIFVGEEPSAGATSGSVGGVSDEKEEEEEESGIIGNLVANLIEKSGTSSLVIMLALVGLSLFLIVGVPLSVFYGVRYLSVKEETD